jgi:hypothetical protein
MTESINEIQQLLQEIVAHLSFGTSVSVVLSKSRWFGHRVDTGTPTRSSVTQQLWPHAKAVHLRPPTAAVAKAEVERELLEYALQTRSARAQVERKSLSCWNRCISLVEIRLARGSNEAAAIGGRTRGHLEK